MSWLRCAVAQRFAGGGKGDVNGWRRPSLCNRGACQDPGCGHGLTMLADWSHSSRIGLHMHPTVCSCESQLMQRWVGHGQNILRHP